MLFEDRSQAGQALAEKLIKFKKEKPVILALARGGVPVGHEVAKKLDAELDVIVSRKLGAPRNPEFGVGAISENNTKILDKAAIQYLKLTKPDLKEVLEQERKELERRVQTYREGRVLHLKDKTVILVDDGIATGVTAKAAIKAIKKLSPKQIILAVPVCEMETVKNIKNTVDEFLYLSSPYEFFSVGYWYGSFEQISDGEVIRLLDISRKLKK